MKYIIILTLLCLSCDEKVMKANAKHYEEEAASDSFYNAVGMYCGSFRYVRDTRTNLCFAVYGCSGSQYGISASNVPCEDLIGKVQIIDFKSSEFK